MKTLHEMYEYVLDNPEQGAKMLDLADKYLRMYDEVGTELILSKEHSYVKCIIDNFAGNPRAFSEWLLMIRSQLPKCAGRILINALYRKVMTRALQRERRAREDRAVKKAVDLGLVPEDYQTKQRYVRLVALEWGKRRMETLEQARRFARGPRISLDEQELILAEFWAEIEKEVERGDIPKP